MSSASAEGENKYAKKVRRRAFWGLRWTAPHPAVPHGLAGAISMLTGLALTVGSLLGDFSLLGGWTLTIYTAAACTSSCAALMIVGTAPKHTQPVFRAAAIMELCLLWQVWRYRPAAAGAAAWPWVLALPMRAVDVGVALGMLSINAYFAYGALTWLRREYGTAVSFGLLFGCFGLLLMTGYPVHLALGGDEWLECVVKKYPMQREGFAGYVYAPTSFVFSAVLFGATLLNRRVITPLEFGVVFGAIVGVLLVSTVLVQEIWIPVVSTQRLILPCPEARPGTMLASVGDTLDTSKLAQTVLKAIGAIPS